MPPFVFLITHQLAQAVQILFHIVFFFVLFFLIWLELGAQHCPQWYLVALRCLVPVYKGQGYVQKCVRNEHRLRTEGDMYFKS